MKKFAVSLVVALAFAAGAQAAEKPAVPASSPATVAAVNKLLTSMNFRALLGQTMQASMGQMQPMMERSVAAAINANPELDAGQKEEALALAKSRLPEVSGKLQAMFTDPAMLDDIQAATVQVYARNYTVAEIEQLSAFYRTPLGKKLLARTPAVAAESSAAIQEVMMPRLEKVMQEIMSSFK
ncbi:DUF2059 domain-containing protein [Pseudoduganella violaceinigra]|uniref:DUF2059 domain-containing protein n=1 Tax=Pseudoduganella violaceinigra TaxID=246602 RepID=UPI00041E8CA1|nr:DUF2059 domain-containing protein [Pseudoduganella violaceinigra]